MAREGHDNERCPRACSPMRRSARRDALKVRHELPIGINVVGQIARITSLRGWLLIGLVAVGVYFVLGIVGVFAWVLGALAGASASTPWDVEMNDEPRIEPPNHQRPSSVGGEDVTPWWVRRLHDDRLRFQRFRSVVDGCPHCRLRPVYS